jgi:rhamnogalacturonyl hydrolase YesR
MFRKGDRTFNCMKSFSAVDDETANNKITEWLDSKINKGEISSYVIDSMKFNTFYEELEERNLDKLFVKEKGTL